MKANLGLTIVIVFIIVMIVGTIFGTATYSTQTGKAFCRDNGMDFYKLSPWNREFFDLRDDVICYRLESTDEYYQISYGVVQPVLELKLYYFERE